MDQFTATPGTPEPPQHQPKSKRLVRAAAAVGTAAGIALGATALAGAVTSASTAPGVTAAQAADPQAPATPAKPDWGGPHHDRHGGPGKEFGFGGPGIHGEFVVPGKAGGYQTLASQKGDVTAVSATSISVKSEDGYDKTYSVDDSTVVQSADEGIKDVKVGDKVHVLATVSGTTYHAVDVRDRTAVESRHDQWAPQRPSKPAPGADANPGDAGTS